MKKKPINALLLILIMICALVIASCCFKTPLEPARTVVQVGEVSFGLLSIPALNFPGGALGTEMNNETRPDTLRIEKAYRLA